MKILVGLSGGVDSAVSAYLLQQQGHAVIGGFMINYAQPDNPRCTTRQDKREAEKVAQFLNIPLHIFDFQQQYKERIIDYIITSYKAGITPNPDVFCNNLIKFDLFLQKAIELGCDKMATGHYARITPPPLGGEGDGGGGHTLSKGIDATKDQSYFLAGLNQEQLSKAIFPLGEMTKKEVRGIAQKIGLPNAERPDSQGLCFIGNVGMKEFLHQYIPIQKGDIVTTDGVKVGEHDGAYAYTIGQKKGLGLNFKAYVVQVHIAENTIIVTDNKEDPALYSTGIEIEDRHGRVPALDKISCKIRYRQEPQPAILRQKGTTYEIQFQEPIRGVPQGQIAVVYDGDIVQGCGIIKKTLHNGSICNFVGKSKYRYDSSIGNNWKYKEK